MSHIKLHYTITETAARAELAAGRPAHRERELDITPNEYLASVTSLKDDGQASISLRRITFEESGERSQYGNYASLTAESPTVLDDTSAEAWVRDVLRQVDAKSAELREKKQERQRETRAAAESEKLKQAEREHQMAAVLDVWERDHAAARAAGVANTGMLKGFSGGHGDGYCVPNSLHERLKALRGQVTKEAEAERIERERSLLRWVEEHAAEHSRPELARAAREGRKLGSTPLELVESVLAERCRAGDCAVIMDNEWSGEPEPREDAPSAEAYRIYDALTERAAHLGEGLPYSVSVLPISRVDVETEKSNVDYRTCVPVRCGGAIVAVLTEPLRREEEESDEY